MSQKLTVSTNTFKIETSPDYQPTEALKIHTPTGVHSKFKEYGNMLVDKVITLKTRKKMIIFSAVTIFLFLALGIPLSNQIKQYNENSIKIEKLLKTAENRLLQTDYLSRRGLCISLLSGSVKDRSGQ